ncbi:hypothetical protein D3C72_2402660 [compost metagenome]
MPDFALSLPAPIDLEQLRTDQYLTLPLGQVAPDHHVDVTELVFQRNEGHAAGGARTLPACHQAGNADRPPVLDVKQLF